MSSKQLTFRDLAIGQEFDWISPIATRNSFFHRCRKVTERKYVALLSSGDMTNAGPMRVGTVSAKVYHVQTLNAEHGL
jgi:hypothetical protein